MSSVGLGAIVSDCFDLILGFVVVVIVVNLWKTICYSAVENTPAHTGMQISDSRQCTSLRISSLLVLLLGSKC